MKKIIELQYNLSKGINIEHINADEYFAVRSKDEKYTIHCQIRYGAELETLIIEAISEANTAPYIEIMKINTVGGNKKNEYPLNLADFIDVDFSSLHTLEIPEQSYFQQTYIYDGFDDRKSNNVIADILKRCPNLETLTLPCYQGTELSKIKLEKLKYLRVVDNYKPDRFLSILTKTPKKNFPSLERISISSKTTRESLDRFLKSPLGKQLNYIIPE